MALSVRLYAAVHRIQNVNFKKELQEPLKIQNLSRFKRNLFLSSSKQVFTTIRKQIIGQIITPDSLVAETTAYSFIIDKL